MSLNGKDILQLGSIHTPSSFLYQGTDHTLFMGGGGQQPYQTLPFHIEDSKVGVC